MHVRPCPALQLTMRRNETDDRYPSTLKVCSFGAGFREAGGRCAQSRIHLMLSHPFGHPDNLCKVCATSAS